MTQPPSGPQPNQAPNPYGQPSYPPAAQPPGPVGYPPGQQPMRPAGQPGMGQQPGGYAQQPPPQQQARPAPGYAPQQAGMPQAGQQTLQRPPSGYAAQPPGQQAAPPQAAPPAQPVKKPKGSPGLGAIGLLLVVIAGIVGLGTTYFLGRAIGWTTATATILKTCVQNADAATCEAQTKNIPTAVSVLHQLELGGTVLSIVAVVGLVAWILCIVAAATRRGKGLGVAGIILGIIFVLAIVGATVGFWLYFNGNTMTT